MTGRPTVLTEERLQKDIEFLSQHVDANGICIGKLPTDILNEYYGYKEPQPLYRDISALEALGRISVYPPDAESYRYGFQIKPANDLEALKLRATASRKRIEEEIGELKNIANALGQLAINQDARVD